MCGRGAGAGGARNRAASGRACTACCRTSEEYSQAHAPGSVNVPILVKDGASGELTPNPAFLQEVGRAGGREAHGGRSNAGRSGTRIAVTGHATGKGLGLLYAVEEKLQGCCPAPPRQVQQRFPDNDAPIVTACMHGR